MLALNAATLVGKLLQLSNGAVYDEHHNIRVIHDQKLDALEDLIEAANGKPVLVLYAYKHDLARIQQRFGKWGPEMPDGVRELRTTQDMEDWNAGHIPVAVTQPRCHRARAKPPAWRLHHRVVRPELELGTL